MSGHYQGTWRYARRPERASRLSPRGRHRTQLPPTLLPAARSDDESTHSGRRRCWVVCAAVSASSDCRSTTAPPTIPDLSSRQKSATDFQGAFADIDDAVPSARHQAASNVPVCRPPRTHATSHRLPKSSQRRWSRRAATPPPISAVRRRFSTARRPEEKLSGARLRRRNQSSAHPERKMEPSRLQSRRAVMHRTCREGEGKVGCGVPVAWPRTARWCPSDEIVMGDAGPTASR